MRYILAKQQKQENIAKYQERRRLAAGGVVSERLAARGTRALHIGALMARGTRALHIGAVRARGARALRFVATMRCRNASLSGLQPSRP